MDVNAGTIVGFAGYNGFENQTAYRAAHVEVFSSDDAIKDFLKNTKKDGENEQKFVKFPKGTEFKTAIPKSVRKDSKVKLLAESTDQYQLVEVENIALTVSDRDATLGEYKSKGNYYEFLADHSAKVSAFNEEAGGIAKIGDKVKLMEDANQVSQKSTREVEHINPAKGLVFWAKKDWIEKKVITLPAVAEPAAVAVEAEVGEGIDPVFANLPAARDLGVVTQPTVEVEPVTVEYDVINLDLSEVHLLNPEAEVSNNKLEVDVVIDLKKGKEYKDDSGKVWRLLDFSDYRADGTLAAYKGLVKEDDLKDRFSAYDWAKFGFRILEDANNDYIFDFKERSDFFKEVCKLVDEDKNGILEPHELQSALNNPYTADKLSKLVCKHHNEWAYGGKHLSGLMSAVEKVFQKGIDLEKDEDRKKNLEELKKERMEAFEAKVKHMSIWEDIVPKEKGFWSSWFEGLLATSPPTAPGYWTFKGTRWVFEKVKEYFSDEVPLKPFPANQPVVYHFHPIAFVEGMKGIFGCFWDADQYFTNVFLPTLYNHEGGYQNKTSDSGNYVDGILIGTNHGISAPVLKAYLGRTPTVEEMKNLSKETATEIYKKNYWSSIRVPEINDKYVAIQYADMYVNSGGNAVKIMKRALNNLGYSITISFAINDSFVESINSANPVRLHQEYKDERIEYYKELIDANPSMKEWEKGWVKRANSFNYGKD